MAGETEAELTAREREVLGLLSEGRANKDIADALGCSVRTVEFHISNLLRKVGASSRLELIARGRAAVPLVEPSNQEAPMIEVRMFAGVAAVALGDTVLTMWKSPASLERWRWKYAMVDEAVRRHPGGVRVLSLVLESSTPPDKSLRAQMKLDVQGFGSKLRLFVVVPLGNSIWRALVRTVGRAVLLLSGSADRQVVESTAEEGIMRLLEEPGPHTPTRAQVVEALAEQSRLLGVASVTVPSRNAG